MTYDDMFMEQKLFRIFDTKNSGIYKYLLLDIIELEQNAYNNYVLDKIELVKSNREDDDTCHKTEKYFFIIEINHWLKKNQNRIDSVQHDDDDETQKAYEKIREETELSDTDASFIYWQLKKHSIIREFVADDPEELKIPSATKIFLKMLKEMNES